MARAHLHVVPILFRYNFLLLIWFIFVIRTKKSSAEWSTAASILESFVKTSVLEIYTCVFKIFVGLLLKPKKVIRWIYGGTCPEVGLHILHAKYIFVSTAYAE